MDEISSHARLAAAQAGDRRALEALLVAQRNGVYRYGLTVCRTTEDAEDAVQEALWAAARAIHTFRGTATAITGWLFAIVRHACFHSLDRWHKKRETGVDRDVLEGFVAAGSLEDDVATHETAQRLAAAVAALDAAQREAIVLRDIEGLSAPEAASRLGISVEALKSRLHRARASLRARFVSPSWRSEPCAQHDGEVFGT